MTEIKRAHEFVVFKPSKSIVSSTNATPIVVTVTAHGYSNGDAVHVSNHLVNTAANGSFLISSVTTNTFELDSSVGNGVGGATGVVVVADFTFTETDFREVPTYGGAGIDLLKGTSRAEPFTLSVLDTGEQVTGNLSGSDGRADLIGRLWRLRINEDAGGLTTVALGRVTGVQMNASVAAYDFQCGDERFYTRGADIYRTVATPTTQIMPAGLRSQYLFHPAAVPMQLIPEVVNTHEVLFLMATGGPIPDGVVEYIKGDLKAGSVPGSSGGNTGNFTNLRVNISGTDYEILSFNAVLADENLLGEIATEGLRGPVVLSYVWVAWASTPVVEDVDEEGYMHAPNHIPSEAMPFHIGGANGVDLMVELTDRYAAEGVRFDATNVFKTWDASTAPDGLYNNPVIPDGHLRITGPMTLGQLEDGLFKTFGLAPFINASGEIAPRLVTLPNTITPGSLTTLTAPKYRSHPTFSHRGRESVTVYRASYDLVRRMLAAETDQERRWPADKLDVTKFDLPEITHDRVADLGRHVHTVHLFGVSEAAEADRLARQQATEIFDMYGDGPIRGAFSGMASVDSVVPGDFVQSTLSSYPDMQTQTRGGPRVLLITERRMGPAGGEFEYIDAGPDDAPLAAPSVAIIKNSGRPKHDVDVTISSLPAGADGYTLQLKVGSKAYRTFGQGTANETVTISNLPSGTAIIVRARAFKVSTIRSAWSTTATVTLTVLAVPSSVSAAISNRAATLSWTIGDATYDTMPTLAGADFLQDPLLAGADRFVFTGLVASTSLAFGVKHVDPYGGASAIVADTQTTGTAATLATPKGLTVRQGAPQTGGVVDPEELPYGAGLELSVTAIEPHAVLEFQVSTDSFSTIEKSIAVSGPDTVKIHLPLDDTSRDCRCRHRKVGSTSSGFTSTVSAKPTPFAQNASVADGFAGGYAFLTLDTDDDMVLSVGTDDPDTDFAYYVANKTGFVEPTTGSSSIARSAMPFSNDLGIIVADTETGYVWLKFWNEVKGFGQSVKAQITTGVSDVTLRAASMEITAETESSGTGTLTIKLSDPDSVADDLYFRTKSGDAAWGSYTLKDATPNDAASYTETVTIVEKLFAEIEFRLRYTIGGTQFVIHQKSSKFDKGKIPNLTGGGIVVDEDAGTVTWGGAGDFDTASAEIDANVGSAPSYPDPTLVAHINVGDGRNFTAAAVNAAYAKFPLAVTEGEIARFAIAYYSLAGGAGAGSIKSTTNYLFEYNRPLPVPDINPVDAFLIFDAGSSNDVTCRVDWNPNAAITNAAHDVKVSFGLMGGAQEASSTEASPLTTLTETATWVGGGTGGSRTWWVECTLLDSAGESLKVYLFNNQPNTT